MKTTDRIQLGFEQFHKDNPQVYRYLVDVTRGYAREGERVGIGHVYEIARHFLWLKRKKLEMPWKLNNNYRSRYARLIMDSEKDLAGYFHTRPLRSSSAAVIMDTERTLDIVSGLQDMR